MLSSTGSWQWLVCIACLSLVAPADIYLCCLLSVLPQQPYYFEWMNHIRAGLYAMTAFVALMLTINCWSEQDLQTNSILTADQKAAQSAARARLLSDLAMNLLPAALGLGLVVSWLRLKIATKRALDKFR
jgi:hypothetical protein